MTMAIAFSRQNDTSSPVRSTYIYKIPFPVKNLKVLPVLTCLHYDSKTKGNKF